MEKAKKVKHSSRAGAMLLLAWFIVASFVMFVTAATNGNGNVTGGSFTWAWQTNNTNTGAAGTFEGNLSGNTLSLEIGATSSTFKEGSCGGSDTNAASTTNTATVTNNTGSLISIMSVVESTATCDLVSGAKLANGETFTVRITANPQSTSDGTPRTANGSVVITFKTVEKIELTYYGAEGATYTYADTLLDDVSDTISETMDVGSSITLPAAPTVSGGVFAGWRLSHDGSLYSAEATVVINNNTSVYPVITAADAIKPFTVGETPYQFWTDAAKAAGTSGIVILNQSYTLPTTMAANGVSPDGSPYVTGTDGNVNFVVPNGVTLLIPFDSSNTLITANHKDKGGLVEGGTSAATGAYRILTMPEGTNITVNGTICMPAKINAPGGGKTNAGAPTGEVPYIVMQGTSNITLNNGAHLYCYGFITGSGSVTVNNGATVYECFQIRDYRGGDGSTSIENGVFPSSQYYIQNVEVPMTFAAGGILKGISAIYVSRALVYMDDIAVIGSSGSLFNNAGTVTKQYDGGTDRLVIDVDGNATLGGVVLVLGKGLISSAISVDSAEYVLGINNNMTININSGNISTSQRLGMQPGSILNIGKNAHVTLGENMYVYDSDEWGDYVYCESMTEALGGIEHPSTESMQDGNNWAAVQVAFAPGKKYTRTLTDLTDARIDVNGTLTATAANIYTTASGAEIVSSEGTGVAVISAGTDTITYQADMNSGSTLAYYEIPINSAWLKNGDGSCVYTENASGAMTYTYANGRWCCSANSWDADGKCTVCESKAVSKIDEVQYHTLGDAVKAYSSGCIMMLRGTDEKTVGDANNKKETICIDLNGNAVKVDNFYVKTLYGMDSATNALGMVKTTDSYTYGTIVGNVSGTVAPAYAYNLGDISRAYVTHIVSGENDAPDTYSFHRARFNIERYTYYPVDKVFQLCALYMSDEKGLAAIDDYALVINGVEKWDSNNSSNTAGLQSVSNETEGYTAVNGFRLFGGDNTANYNGNISVNAAIKVDNKVVDKENPVPLDLTGGANE